jgi:hypothetical protein
MPTLRPQVAVASYRALLQESRSHLLRKYGTVSAVSTPRSALENALEASAPRNNWTKEEIKEIYDTPLMKLAYAAVCVNASHISKFAYTEPSGHHSQKVPQSCLDSDVYPHEHQDRRLQ